MSCPDEKWRQAAVEYLESGVVIAPPGWAVVSVMHDEVVFEQTDE